MFSSLPINRHYIAHLEFLIIWSLLVLKISDYWIQTGGSELLPEKWIFYSQTVDQAYQKLLVTTGFGCSIVISYSILAHKCYPLWNIVLGSLWIVMLFLSFPLERAIVSFILCAVASIQIISGLLKKGSKHSKHKSKKIKIQSSKGNMLSTNASVANPPCDLDFSKLDIGTSKNIVPPSSSPTVQSQAFAKPRPVISPSRFSSSSIMSSNGNLTKASWVAGGYWQGNNWPSPTFSSPSQIAPLTRSSSQSSGFGSVQTGLLNRSPPDSRPDSTLEDLDRFSVFSDNNAEPRFSDSNLRFRDNSSSIYPYTNEVSPKSIVSSVSSMNGSVHHTSTNPSTNNQWSWLPFMFGFSLAVNVCVISYFVLLHYSQTGHAYKLHS